MTILQIWHVLIHNSILVQGKICNIYNTKYSSILISNVDVNKAICNDDTTHLTHHMVTIWTMEPGLECDGVG